MNIPPQVLTTYSYNNWLVKLIRALSPDDIVINNYTIVAPRIGLCYIVVFNTDDIINRNTKCYEEIDIFENKILFTNNLALMITGNYHNDLLIINLKTSKINKISLNNKNLFKSIKKFQLNKDILTIEYEQDIDDNDLIMKAKYIEFYQKHNNSKIPIITTNKIKVIVNQIYNISGDSKITEQENTFIGFQDKQTRYYFQKNKYDLNENSIL